MDIETIKNDLIAICVKSHGAELSSILHNGREYLWQADPKYWGRHSPVLFPIVGSVWHGEYRTKGTTYRLSQHGFARDMDFTLESKTDDEIKYILKSNEKTIEKYPYEFLLEIGYRLIGNRVRVHWRVENKGDEEMPFQIGAHPAFYWPMLSSQSIASGLKDMEEILQSTDQRGYFKFETKSTILIKSVIAKGGCFGGVTTQTLDKDFTLPLTVETFSRDALVFEDSQVTKVTLCDDDKKPYISLEFTAPLVGLWSPPGKRAPFVCIEPWYGRADSVDYNGEFSDRKWMQTLTPHESFDAEYDIIIE